MEPKTTMLRLALWFFGVNNSNKPLHVIFLMSNIKHPIILH